MPIDVTSRKFVPRLKGLGYDVTYREYERAPAASRPPPSCAKASSGFCREGDNTRRRKRRRSRPRGRCWRWPGCRSSPPGALPRVALTLAFVAVLGETVADTPSRGR